jgi:acyl carrier protein/uncharacterized protein YndB with AHSA1/START domain
MNTVTMDDLRRILVDCAGGAETIRPATDMRHLDFATLGYDSLALIETAARLRREFGVAISDTDITELTTPAQLLAAINPTPHTTRHSVVVNAPAAVVYPLLADVTLAPTLFAAPLWYLRESGDRVRVWVLANGEVASWTSVRRLDPVNCVITFEQTDTHPLVSSMRGEFRLIERDGTTEVLLDHEFVTRDVDFVTRATNTNSSGQLAALRTLAELPLAELLYTTTDTVEARGRAEDAYEFVHDVDRWPDRLPHIDSLDVHGDGDVQYLTKDVGGQVSESVRLCFPHERIVFKQTTPPAALLGNAGEWTFTPTVTGCAITVRHTVLLDPDTDRGRTRAAIAATARHTLAAARRFAEQRAHR